MDWDWDWDWNKMDWDHGNSMIYSMKKNTWKKERKKIYGKIEITKGAKKEGKLNEDKKTVK